MTRLFISTLAFLAIFQCCAPPEKKLVVDKTAEKMFNPKELDGFIKTISFVDSIILYNTNATDINQAYHAYFGKLESCITEGKMYPTLLKDTTKFEFLKTLEKESFDAIWEMNDNVRYLKYRDTLMTDLQGFKYLVFNYTGKYLSYLKEIGKSDSLYAVIYESIEIAGDISPSTVGWFPTQQKKIDFNLFKNRLWAAVFLLRFGDPFEEQVQRYLREKNSSKSTGNAPSGLMSTK